MKITKGDKVPAEVDSITKLVGILIKSPVMYAENLLFIKDGIGICVASKSTLLPFSSLGKFKNSVGEGFRVNDETLHYILENKPLHYMAISKELDIPWDRVHEDLNYVAMDRNGHIIAFPSEPSFSPDLGKWVSGDRPASVFRIDLFFTCSKPDTRDAKLTLTKRPL